MIDLKEITDHINRETTPKSTFTLEWLESRLKPIYGPVMCTFTYLIDTGFLIYSYRVNIMKKGERIDELFYKRKDTKHAERRRN